MRSSTPRPSHQSYGRSDSYRCEASRLGDADVGACTPASPHDAPTTPARPMSRSPDHHFGRAGGVRALSHRQWRCSRRAIRAGRAAKGVSSSSGLDAIGQHVAPADRSTADCHLVTREPEASSSRAPQLRSQAVVRRRGTSDELAGVAQSAFSSPRLGVSYCRV